MELFSSVRNTGAFTLCFMRSFRRRITVGSLAGALLFGLAHYRLAGALLFGLAHYRLADALLFGLAHYCLAGALLLDRCGALLLGRRTAAGIGARRGRLAAAVRTMRRRRRPCF